MKCSGAKPQGFRPQLCAAKMSSSNKPLCPDASLRRGMTGTGASRRISGGRRSGICDGFSQCRLSLCYICRGRRPATCRSCPLDKYPCRDRRPRQPVLHELSFCCNKFLMLGRCVRRLRHDVAPYNSRDIGTLGFVSDTGANCVRPRAINDRPYETTR